MAQSKAKLYERLRTVQPLPKQHLFLLERMQTTPVLHGRFLAGTGMMMIIL